LLINDQKNEKAINEKIAQSRKEKEKSFFNIFAKKRKRFANRKYYSSN